MSNVIIGRVFAGPSGSKSNLVLTIGKGNNSYNPTFYDFSHNYVFSGSAGNVNNGTYQPRQSISNLLSKHMLDNLTDLISVVTRSISDNCLEQFDSVDYSTHNYVTNSNFVFNDVDLECITVHNTGYRRRSCLITPQHIAFARHTEDSEPGTVVTFAKKDGTIVQRTVVAKETQTGSQGVYYKQDLGVGLLDSPILDIEPAKVLGPGFFKLFGVYLNYNGVIVNGFPYSNYIGSEPVPIYLLPRTNKVILRHGRIATNTVIFNTDPNIYRFDALGVDEDSIPDDVVEYGDSGTAIFLIINGYPCYLGAVTFYTGTYTSLTDQNNWNQLQDIISSLSTHPSASEYTVSDYSEQLTSSYYSFGILSQSIYG